jgi:hypothetical protein
VVEAAAPAFQYDPETKVMAFAFRDLHLVSSGGVDVFAADLNDWAGKLPFYLEVDGRIFALQPSNTYLVTGHGARLPAWIAAEEEEGRLTILAEREDRYLVYSHDTLAVDEDDEAEGADEDGDEEATTEDEAAE